MPVDTAKGHRDLSVLISGAGAAGQSLGFWLRRHGYRPTVIERAPAPRAGGFAIDLRGAAVWVAERMGILDACRKVRVRMREMVRVDRNGDVVWKTDGNFGAGEGVAGDVEILRDDLTQIMQETVCDGIEYIFGDSITSIVQDAAGVDVTFAEAPPRRFDLVIGADGLHSKVRALAFGPEAKFARLLNHYIAIFTIPNFLDLDRQWIMCYLPGKMANIMQYGRDKHTRAMFLFASPPLVYDRNDLEQQKALIKRAFEGDTSWEIPALLNGLQEADDLYFDEVTQIHMDSWSNGRVALVGDAACAPTAVTGQGTSLAVIGAYVLAGELKAANGDHRIAFGEYEKAMRAFVEQNQRIAVACPELAIPATWEELEQRDERFRLLQESGNDEPAEDSAAVMMQAAANAISLKDYLAS